MKDKKNIWLVLLPRYVLFLFIILQVLAMINYSGGTFFNSENEGYSFIRNFLSDLGRVKSFSGNINFISCQLFNMSLIGAGIVFIIFYFNVHSIFSNSTFHRMAQIGSIFGVLSGIALITVGLTPADLYLPLHAISAKWIFRSFFIASICYSLTIYKSADFQNRYAFVYLLFSISIMLYIFISEFGPHPTESEIALTIQVVSQKVILLILIITIYLQTWGIHKLTK